MTSIVRRSSDMGRILDCRDDARVGSAAADVLVHRLHDGFFCRMSVRRQKSDGSHDHARRTVAALHRLVSEEGPLKWMQLPVFVERLDCSNRFALQKSRARLARLHRLLVDEHGTGAAMSFAAA